MKAVKITTLKDGATFRLNPRSRVKYSLQSKKGGRAVYTSLNSGNTYFASAEITVFVTF